MCERPTPKTDVPFTPKVFIAPGVREPFRRIEFAAGRPNSEPSIRIRLEPNGAATVDAGPWPGNCECRDVTRIGRWQYLSDGTVSVSYSFDYTCTCGFGSHATNLRKKDSGSIIIISLDMSHVRLADGRVNIGTVSVEE